jgi:hypothetical protein
MATTHRGCATGFGNQNGYQLKKGNVKNFAAFLKQQKQDIEISKRAIISTILNLVPTDMSIENSPSN